jgi:WD40 repeat protein
VYSPSGHQIASGSHDYAVRLWDAQTGAPGPILNGHSSFVTSVVYSPSGHQIASSGGDNTVRLWDVYLGQYLTSIGGFHGEITSIAWKLTLEGTYVVTGSSDCSVRMWQVITERNYCWVRLHWSSIHGGLVISQINIQDVQGLSSINKQLLQQRCDVGVAIPPLKSAALVRGYQHARHPLYDQSSQHSLQHLVTSVDISQLA